MIYYLKVTPLIEGNNLIGPKETLKAKGTKHECFMAPDGKGYWFYKYEAEDEMLVKELVVKWPSCVSVKEGDALAQIHLWKDPVSVLAEIDLKSIRSIREYIAAQPDAPGIIKDYEAAAFQERQILVVK